jgi:ADP-ribose pyrophosphatase YjhB (NUDIX family)
MLGQIWKSLKLPKNLQLFLMRFIQDQFLIGVTGIFFDQQDRILLFKHTYRKNAWSLPGGYIKSTEHPEEGLVREVEEESSLTVCVDGPIKLRTDREQARIDITYYGTYIGGEFKPSKEVSKATLFPFNALPQIPKDQLIFINRALKIKTAKNLK